jgi:hypothetical protein
MLVSKPLSSDQEIDYTNPGFMKLALYCEGLKLSETAESEILNGREITRTRAGLGSGLELVLPGNLWVNAPVTEHFCEQSSLLLEYTDHFFISNQKTQQSLNVELAPRPTWYSQKCSTGKQMMRVGTLQGTYLGIYPTEVCEFWTRDIKENCKFCSVGLNLGKGDSEEKKLTEVLEVVEAARNESKITYVDFNTGHYDDESFLDKIEPMIRAIKERTNLLVGIQTPPHSNLKRYDRLKAMGVNRVSFCFELIDPEHFEKTCPGKAKTYGLERYLAAMDYCASLGKKVDLKQPWVTNGEIIAGLEPPEKSIEAIDRITSVGAIPTVCVFRPLKGTDYEGVKVPKTEEMVPVFRHFYEACMRKGLPVGVAPNIHVSLVMLPEECAYLSPLGRGFHFLKQKLGLKFKKMVYRSMFQKSLAEADAKRAAEVMEV